MGSTGAAKEECFGTHSETFFGFGLPLTYDLHDLHDRFLLTSYALRVHICCKCFFMAGLEVDFGFPVQIFNISTCSVFLFYKEDLLLQYIVLYAPIVFVSVFSSNFRSTTYKS